MPTTIRKLKEKKVIPTIVLGADPEFVMEKGGVMVRANSLVRDAFCGFGADGGGASIAEIRPGYSENIIELIAKIEKTMKMGNSRLGLHKKTDRWLAGHYKHDRSIGGHIHIESNETINANTRSSYRNLGTLLDFYMEDCLEDLIAPPGERLARLATAHYGKKYKDSPDSIRAQDAHRIEYRAPGSWLLTPKIAYAYLYVAKAATILDAMKISAGSILGQSGSNQTGDDKANYLLEMSHLLQEKATKMERDMVLGAEILEEVIHEIPDWNQDFRVNWM